MGFCSVPGCSNSSNNSHVSFHCFPLKNSALLKRWVHNIQRKDFIPKGYSRVCGKHFTRDSFVKDRSVYCPSLEPFRAKRLKPDAVPTIFGHKPVKPHGTNTVLRHQRREVRTRQAFSGSSQMLQHAQIIMDLGSAPCNKPDHAAAEISGECVN